MVEDHAALWIFEEVVSVDCLHEKASLNNDEGAIGGLSCTVLYTCGEFLQPF